MRRSFLQYKVENCTQWLVFYVLAAAIVAFKSIGLSLKVARAGMLGSIKRKERCAGFEEKVYGHQGNGQNKCP
jgi:hypothetical protein